MFSRIVLRVIPSSLQTAKFVALQSSKQIRNGPSVSITPSAISKSVRNYSEKVNETVAVDYEYVKKASSNNDVLIVDVREPDEIKEHGKIPNSINIPLGSVTSTLSTMADKEFQQNYQRAKPTEDTEIIFYCMIGKRSGMAQQNAMNLGFKNVKNYLGSWIDWAAKTV